MNAFLVLLGILYSCFERINLANYLAFPIFAKIIFSIFENNFSVISIFRDQKSILFKAENLAFQLLFDSKIFIFFRKIMVFAPACNFVAPIRNLNGLLQQVLFTMQCPDEVYIDRNMIKSTRKLYEISKIDIFRKSSFFAKLKAPISEDFSVLCTFTFNE